MEFSAVHFVIFVALAVFLFWHKYFFIDFESKYYRQHSAWYLKEKYLLYFTGIIHCLEEILCFLGSKL